MGAVPDRPEGDKSKKPMLSRAEQLKREHNKRGEWWYEPDAPEVSSGRYLIDYLFDVGPCMEGAMGAVSLSYQEILAWQINLGLRLAPWEVRMLKTLSREFVSMSNDARDIDCEAPWGASEYAQTSKQRTAMAMKQSVRDTSKT